MTFFIIIFTAAMLLAFVYVGYKLAGTPTDIKCPYCGSRSMQQIQYDIFKCNHCNNTFRKS